MKRASLNAVPPPAKTESADLTDRLLAREAAHAEAPAPKPKRRRPASRAKPTAAVAPPAAGAAEPEPALQVIEEPAALVEALRQAKLATEALDSAARQAPARYHLGLRVRLDALAHHVRQVADFVAALSER